MNKPRMSAEERAELLAKREQDRIDDFNNPEKVARRAWIIEAFHGDIEQVAHFAVALMDQSSIAQKESDDFMEKLNRIYSMAYGLSELSKAKPHQKRNIARMCLDIDADDPIAKVFMSALKTGRTLAASENARKGHIENHAMRDDIYKWLDQNKTPSMSLDDAAEMMAGKVVPLKFRAVRNHCTAWKKLQSASKE